jgi:hypothetical protein
MNEGERIGFGEFLADILEDSLRTRFLEQLVGYEG